MDFAKKYVWIGDRYSDIKTDNLFENAVVSFGYDDEIISFEAVSGRRINHNIHNETIIQFIIDNLQKLISENNNVRFMFYNQKIAYKMPGNIIAHSVCINERHLLEILDDKAMSRRWLGNSGRLLPYFSSNSSELSYDLIREHFPNHAKYVVQKTQSSGGSDTYFVSSEQDLMPLKSLGRVLVSPYAQNCIAINGHAVIYKDRAIIFPSSIQIVTRNKSNQMIYRGGDFIAYQYLETNIRKEIELQICNITEKLRQDGYRGIVGIDFLVFNHDVYFMEINPRFQASSRLINRALISCGMPSLQKLNLESFGIKKAPVACFSNFNVPYSSFAYLNGDKITRHIFTRFNQAQQVNGICIDTDGYTVNCASAKGAYAFRLIFPFSISSSDHWYGTRIHPNLHESTERSSAALIETKIDLLNGGFYISDDTAVSIGELRVAVFNSHDIEVNNELRINCPNTPMSILSPYEVKRCTQNLTLKKHGEYCSSVKIDIENSTMNRELRSGILLRDIAFLSTDRIRIKHSSICKYHKTNEGCFFCSEICKPEFTLDDVVNAIDICLLEINFRHFLIGGGSSLSEQASIEKIIKHIRSKSDKGIYVMCLPPEKESDIRSMYENGVDEIAFNLELYSPEFALKYMPGKGTIPQEHYFNSLKYAVSLWGNTGNVRSMLIVGLEPTENTLIAIKRLCEIGVQPMLSIFRPLEKTELMYVMPPQNSDLFHLYQAAVEICDRYGQILGPTCIQCRNNTLS